MVGPLPLHQQHVVCWLSVYVKLQFIFVSQLVEIHVHLWINDSNPGSPRESENEEGFSEQPPPCPPTLWHSHFIMFLIPTVNNLFLITVLPTLNVDI